MSHIEEQLLDNEKLIGKAKFNYLSSLLMLPVTVLYAFLVYLFRIEPFIICLYTFIYLMLMLLIALKYLPIGFELVVSDKRIIGKKTILSKNIVDIPLDKISKVNIRSSILGRLFKYETIIISTADSTIKFDSVSNADAFRKVIHEAIDLNKT